MAEDTMFQDAVAALRRGDKPAAKDLLTKLLKADQKNVQYWIWLSAAVESNKERIYCLQTALQLDPENAAAKRGLVLLGALPPDENVQPFSLNRPRQWQEELTLASDKPKVRGLKAFIAKPAVRLAGLGTIGLAVTALIVFGLVLPKNNPLPPRTTNTPGPSPTYTLTPTFVNATPKAPPSNSTLVPLAELLEVPYTPTPLYVNTPRQPQSIDQFHLVMKAYADQEWDTVITGMREIARSEPTAADPYYFIGEAYRFKKDYRNALEAYNQALKINPNFGPAYLGLARARLLQEPDADITKLLDAALEYDPNFGEVYLERGMYYLRHKDPNLALTDLTTAERLLPGSPLVYYYQAQAYLALDNLEKTLDAAEKANQADITMLPAYFTLGQIYVAQGEYAKAVEVLQSYTGYQTHDALAQAMLGEAYYRTGDCESAIEAMSRAISLDSTRRDTYLYRGLCYVEAENVDAAEFDLRRALQVYKEAFAPNLGMMRVYMLQEHFGDAYLQGERVLALAETDEELAQAYYWRALNFEKRDDPKHAAISWQELLKLPRSSMTDHMHDVALKHFFGIWTATPSFTPISTQTPAQTKTSAETPSPSPTK